MNNLPNIIAVSFKSIMKNKRRNILTIIGIVIGIAAVMTIMFLGNGFKHTANKEFEDTGAGKHSATIMYMPNSMDSKTKPFKNEDLQTAKQVDGVKSAKVKEDDDMGYNAKLTNSNKNGDLSVFKTKSQTTTDEGKGFSEDANDTNDKVVVIDHKLAKDVFHNDAVGKTLFIDNQGFKVVGVADKGGGMFGGGDNAVQMPTGTFKAYMKNLSTDMPQLQLKLTDDANKKDVAKKVEKQLSKKGTASDKGQYSYNDMEQNMKSFNKIFDGITYFVAAVAGISLFIAGIGVMNVMYISVAERTEEIAIRRAFGAKSRDIEIQFLVESVVLCLLGGIIGLILGILFSFLVDAVTPKYVSPMISFGPVLIAVGVSTLIGVVFGWVPARAAAKKELIDIIK
ncbi:ABC transporter permease [Staphylococcus pettenkoferi]|uniref:ABC transporter permease n=1 Tax=Staphylococcus pettenkoferi TaxID=170573 RepID=A0A9Q4DA44_9STAP|nr:ABC transporter permease [Staphylococcus pettenkoferi]MCY1568649.1 ABC transporter permease [Staphylococcus pettenkoferi]MCY1576200.1 ABC transporter permease [Staphylococcus pettenkoferi]MCY1595679.1 ABC transporter permease [Staphylococcus pettenkoferi]MCY1619076.1 ABC transporter permease [Staphylococcus pettenkoferi]